ncbi:hypothetical protein G9A89_001599 [Geosiphon pyriformis]|nr:hypothetical protein G9A89_001599 [Geosiphon pyriformis]
MKKAISLAEVNDINVNTDLKKQSFCSNRAVVIKKILINTPKNMIITAVSEFGVIKSIKVQLIEIWQKAVVKFAKSDSMHGAKVVRNCDVWASKNQFRALLFILPMGTTAHDFGAFLKQAGRKTCIINCLLETGNRFCCAVVGFKFEEVLESAFCTVPNFGRVQLSWARLNLVWCEKYRCFGHSILKCNMPDTSSSNSPVLFKKHAFGVSYLQLAKLYAKKNVPISCSVAFGGKSWAQVVSLASSSSGSPSGSGVRSGASSFGVFGLNGSSSSVLSNNSFMVACLASLECSLEILGNQVSSILKKLSFVDLVPLELSLSNPSLVVSVPVVPVLDSDMALNNELSSVPLLSSVNELVANLSLSSFKILTAKFEGVRVFTSGLDARFCGAGVAIFMNNSLACHVSKVIKVKSRVLLVCLLFKNKLSILVIGLYMCAFGCDRFVQASVVNFFIVNAVNKSSFVVLDGDFNEDNFVKDASLRKCLGLGLNNSRGVSKVLDYIFVSNSLASAVVHHEVDSVSEFFDTDHLAVSILVGFGGLLDFHLNSLHKHTNKNCWKFKIKNADVKKWALFKDFSGSALLGSLAKFEVFSKYWFSEFNCARNRHFSKFFRLELLVVKLLRMLKLDNASGFNHFVDAWFVVDPTEASLVHGMIDNGVCNSILVGHLSKIHKYYRKFKYFESEVAKGLVIRDAIDKCMEKFSTDKGGIIKSILEWPFHKVVLDYLVVDDSLILEPDEVKLKVDDIIVNWTRKKNAFSVLSGPWAQQYAPLDYVNNSAFSLVICDISMSEMSLVINNLPDGKAASLFGIPNELWKHADALVLECLLALLNYCLYFGDILILWKKTWVSMIPKPYDWDGILSKILSDRIFFACSKFDVLHGNNFSVLKGMSTQSLFFAVSFIVEDALEKDCELWLVLQNMCKAYNSIGWPHLKASLRHVKMFKTDFHFSDGYRIIRQDHLCGYQINFNFVAKTSRIETSRSIMSFFAAGAFVNDTIWVKNEQASTQHIFGIASEFFSINDININNKKTVTIPINKKVSSPVLSINGQAIAIAKPDKSHRYLGIFLSTYGLFKPSLAKVSSDVQFFLNLVFQKAISDKQFSYLVSAVLQPIVSYRTQFSFVFRVVCQKWDILIRKGLRLKTCLLRNFPNEVLYHLFLYGLKFFEQLQAEYKVASIVQFANASGILGQLFDYHLLDLQVLCWASLNPLQFSVKLKVTTFNNFLVGVVCLFVDNKLFLVNYLPNAFQSSDRFSMSVILGDSLYFNVACSLKLAGVAFGDQLLDKNGSFMKASAYMNNFLNVSPSLELAISCPDVLNSAMFAADEFCVYTNSFLKGLGMPQVTCGAAAYFPSLNRSLEVEVHGVLLSTLAELQAVALALMCVPASCLVALYTDSQTSIDACVFELEWHHVVNLIKSKDFSVCWIKVKSHANIAGNVKVDALANQTAHSGVSLPAGISDRYMVANGKVVSGNAHHFVGPGQSVWSGLFGLDVDWNSTTLVWHSDSYMFSESTCRTTAALHTYFMKARLYDKAYSGILCLFCGNVELSDHVFTCANDVSACSNILNKFGNLWRSLLGCDLALPSSVLSDLSLGLSDIGLYSVFCKGFATVALDARKKAIFVVVDFVHHLAEWHRLSLWLFRAKFRVNIEREDLIGDDSIVPGPVGVSSSPLSAGAI